MKLNNATNKDQIKELKVIADKHDGVLKPDDVVKFAKSSKTSLHKAFDWDDTTAAHKWRIDQARALIRFSVEVITIKNKDVTVRVFMSPVAKERDSNGNGNSGYKLVSTLLKTKMGRQDILDTALSELETFKNKYSWLSELVEVFVAIEATKKIMNGERTEFMKKRLAIIKTSAENHREV